MKKIIFLLLINSVVFAQAPVKVQNFPTTTTGVGGDFLIKDKAAGGAGGTQKISVDNFVSTYSLTQNAANTFVPYTGANKDVDLNGKTLSNVSSFTVTTNALFQNDSYFNDSYFGDALRYGNNGDQGRTTWDSGGLFVKGGGTGLNLQLGSNNRKMVRLIDSINTVFFLSPICVNTYSVDASAILKLESTTQGFLPPRMTTTQRDAIGSPTNGLIIYNSTTTKPQFYNSGWNDFGSNFFTDAGTSTYLTSTTDLFGVGTSSVTASLTIKGQGATAGTDWLNAINNSGTKMITSHNDGRINFGSYTSELSGASLKYHFIGINGRTSATTFDATNTAFENNGANVISIIAGSSNYSSLHFLPANAADEAGGAYIRRTHSTGVFSMYNGGAASTLPFFANTDDGDGGFTVLGINATSSTFSKDASLGTYVSTIHNGAIQLWAGASSGGATLKDSYGMYFRTNYWDGSNNTNNSYIKAIAINTAGLHKLSFNVAGAEKMHIKSNGVVNIPPISATAASALTPAEGDIIIVNTTNGTFLVEGLYSYSNGAWRK